MSSQSVLLKGDCEGLGGRECVGDQLKAKGYTVCHNLHPSVSIVVIPEDFENSSARAKWVEKARANGAKVIAESEVPAFFLISPLPSSSSSAGERAGGEGGRGSSEPVAGAKRARKARVLPDAAADIDLDAVEAQAEEDKPAKKRRGGGKSTMHRTAATAVPVYEDDDIEALVRGPPAHATSSAPSAAVPSLSLADFPAGSIAVNLVSPVPGFNKATVYVLPTGTVSYFKEQIRVQVQFPPGAKLDTLRVLFAGRELKDTEVLMDARVTNAAVVNVMFQVPEAPKAASPAPAPKAKAASPAKPSQPKQKDSKSSGLAYAGGEFPDPIPGEKRARTFRPTLSSGAAARMDRAMTQRLFLVDRTPLGSGHGYVFDVLGSTGNLYHITISHTVDCTCPDFARSNLCKHVIFVITKVLRVPPTNPLSWQPAFLTNELQYIFEHAPDPSRASAVLARAEVREAAAKATGKSLSLGAESASSSKTGEEGGNRKPVTADDNCAICFEELGADLSKLTYCTVCGNNIHKECMKQWVSHKKADATCPYCRSKWMDPTVPAAGAGGGAASGFVVQPGEFLNLGQLAGLPQRRDTSTYEPYWNRRRRGYFYGRHEEYEEDDGGYY